MSTAPATSTPTTGAGPEVVLRADRVSVIFDGRDIAGNRVPVRACNRVSLDLHRGEIVALVGESGSGKTTLARALGRVLHPDEGQVLFQGEPVTARTARRAYAKDVQVVYQDPFASLNSLKTLRHIIGRAVRIHHRGWSSKEVEQRTLELLELVVLTPSADYIDRFPTALSGGQRQRVSIARALAVEPQVLLADEPTSMLDVSMRLDILNLLDKIRQETGVAVLYITHDIASARYISDRMVVMYSGEVVEAGETDALITDPQHPYTQLLLSSAPDPSRVKADIDSLEVVAGEPADPSSQISGCRFSPRCPHVMERCLEQRPPVIDTGVTTARCWLHAGDESTTQHHPTPEKED